MSPPFFSVITCCRNAAPWIESCLQSVAIQDSDDYEHVLVEGNSDDGTQEIAARHARTHARVTMVVREARGISDAMNEGIRQARGRYVIHLHADDLLAAPQVLSTAKLFLTATGVDWAYGKAESVGPDGSHRGWYLSSRRFFQTDWRRPLARRLVKWVDFIPHQATFVKRSVFDEHGLFDESLSCGMDPDLWNRIADKTRWGYLDLVVCRRRVHALARSTGDKHADANYRDFCNVKKRYMNPVELLVAKTVYRLHHFNR